MLITNWKKLLFIIKHIKYLQDLCKSIKLKSNIFGRVWQILGLYLCIQSDEGLQKIQYSIFSHDMWVFSSLAWFGTVVFPFVFVYEHVIMMRLKLRKIKILTREETSFSYIIYNQISSNKWYFINKFVTAFLCQDHQPIHGGRFII